MQIYLLSRGMGEEIYFKEYFISSQKLIFKNNISEDLEAEDLELNPFMTNLKLSTNTTTPDLIAYHLENTLCCQSTGPYER